MRAFRQTIAIDHLWVILNKLMKLKDNSQSNLIKSQSNSGINIVQKQYLIS